MPLIFQYHKYVFTNKENNFFLFIECANKSFLSVSRSNVPQRVQQSQGTTDEDTSGYFSDSRTSPSVWKSRSERARPRMYLPSEGASKKAYHYGQHDTNSEDSQHFILNQQDDELDKSYMTLAGKMNKHSFANEAENMTRDYSTGVNVQGRKLLSNNGVDESEHEIDFSMPKYQLSEILSCDFIDFSFNF